MAQNENDTGRVGARSGTPQGDSSRSWKAHALGGLYMVVAWRSIAILTGLAVLTATISTILAWPLWGTHPREIVIERPPPNVPEADLSRARGEIERLKKVIAGYENEIARKRSSCSTPAEEATEPKAQQSQPDQGLDCTSTCRLCRENKTELRGNVSISLAWDSLDDLDLYLFCPDGEWIKWNKKKACGGELNIDMNVSANMSPEPIENITLTESSPAGRYRIGVHFYRKQNDAVNKRAYQGSLTMGGQTQKFAGEVEHVATNSPPSIVHEFDLVPSKAERPSGGGSFQLQCEACNCASRDQSSVPNGAATADSLAPEITQQK